jgi:hypothetical protein
MQPQLSHRSKIYVLRSEIVDAVLLVNRLNEASFVTMKSTGLSEHHNGKMAASPPLNVSMRYEAISIRVQTQFIQK